jgi:hypothetical protein
MGSKQKPIDEAILIAPLFISCTGRIDPLKAKTSTLCDVNSGSIIL